MPKGYQPRISLNILSLPKRGKVPLPDLGEGFFLKILLVHTMIIRYFATLRDIAHRKEETWDKPASTLFDLLCDLCDKYGPQFRSWIVNEDDQFGGLSIVLVNGIDCRSLQGNETILKSDDIIAIFPPLAGG